MITLMKINHSRLLKRIMLNTVVVAIRERMTPATDMEYQAIVIVKVITIKTPIKEFQTITASLIHMLKNKWELSIN